MKKLRVRKQYWTAAEEQYLRQHYADGKSVDLMKALGRKIGKIYQKAQKLGLAKSKAYLAQYARLQKGQRVSVASEFPKGHVPANKGLRRPGWSPGRMKETQFKKGERAGVAVKLWKPIGTERLSKDGYLERKINDDLPLQRRWRAVHLIIWEETHGPLPPGHAVVFKNGDKKDIRLDNLEMIRRAELMARNTVHNLPPVLKEVIQLKGALKRVIRRKEKENAEKPHGGPAESSLRDA